MKLTCNILWADFVRSGILTVLLVTAAAAFSQNLVQGKVSGLDGLPLFGVTVRVNGTPVATTDSAGRFSVSVKITDTLAFSFVGYDDYQTIFTKPTFLEVVLAARIIDLNEVLLVGYGKSRRSDLTGAVDQVSAANVNRGNSTNPIQELQGKVAGLVITQPGGDPNGEFVVRLRGATSLEGQPPLLVVDGVAIDDFNKGLSMVNPADIASFTILKDASATAIYAARGANGVILIKTKSAQASAPFIQYDGSLAIETPARFLDLLTADEWRTATAAIGGPYFDKGASTNWQKVVSRTAYTHNHFLSFGSSSRQLNVRGSVGYTRQQGIIINNGKEQVTGRLSLNQRLLNDRLELNFSLNTSLTNRNFLADQFSTNQNINGGSVLFGQVANYLPVWPVYDSTGYYIPSGNPLGPAFLLNEPDGKQRESLLQGSLKADYRFKPGLTMGFLLALTRGHENFDRFQPTLPGFSFPAEATRSNAEKQNYTGDVHIHYRTRFGKHNLDLTGAYEYNAFTNQGFRLTAKGFLVPQLLTNNLGAANSIQTGDISSFKNAVRLISFLGRAVYQFDERYILTATLRRDGSSKFGPGNRWGLFPSFAFAWRANNEAFLRDLKWLNSLKFRVSYGQTGNQENLPPNSYQQLYGPAGNYLYNGSFQQSYAVTQEFNPDLKWEVRKSFNLGLDLSLWNNRLNATVDLYRDRTSDMLFLYDLPQPPFLTTQVYANAANAYNRGMELTISGEMVETSHFSWTLSGNIATLRNRVTNLNGRFRGRDLSIANRHYGYASGNGYSGAYISEIKVGYPAGVFWIPQHAGLDNNGAERFNNYDAQGVLTGTSLSFTDQDRVYIDPTPEFTYGLSNQFRYHDFNLGFLIRGVKGQKIFANSLMELGSTLALPYTNVLRGALADGFRDLPATSTFWLRNGSFARLENLSLTYTFRRLRKINQLSLTATGTNLLLLTPYKGLDPEVATEGSQRYIDRNTYPKASGVIISLKIVP